MNTDSTKPPLEPVLIPDSPDQTTPPGKERSLKKPEGQLPPGPDHKKPMFTLEDAFMFTQSESQNTSDLEKAIRATAFLLAWASEGANEEPDGYLAFGLTRVLERCADQVGRLFTYDDIERLGADPRKVREARSESQS
jgi:hypothetical protein